MIKAILNGILSLVVSIVNVILTPINSIIDSLFPNMATAINNFTNMCNSFFSSGFTWLLQFIPPLTKQMILLWLTFEIAYYGIIWGYTLVIKIYNIIQKIKFW